MKCEIVKDLLPSYIDGLTSSESNSEVEEHLETCQECKETLALMKTEVIIENVELNKKAIQPFKKLNKRVMQSILLTLAVCIVLVVSYYYFFEIGWKVDSNDIAITYSYENDTLWIDFELTNGRVLNSWSKYQELTPSITFTECFDSILDDIGNTFSYGISTDENGSLKTFTDEDYLILHFKDKTETLYFKDIARELGLQ